MFAKPRGYAAALHLRAAVLASDAPFPSCAPQKEGQRCAHTKLLLLIQNCMLQRLYSINIYSLQKNMVLEPFKITGKTNKQKNKSIK